MVKLPKPYYKWAEASVRPEGAPPERPIPAHTKVVLPVESFGHCRAASSCGNWRVWLADGWCVEHWDDGLGTTATRPPIKV